MKLTQKEKAERYDSLQLAINEKIKDYRKLSKEYEDRVKDAYDLKAIDCFNYGFAKAYKEAAKDLEMWI